MGRPPLKSTKALIKAELVAKAKFQASPLGIQSALIEAIQRIDPMELISSVGAAFIIYDLFKNVDEFSIASATSSNEIIANIQKMPGIVGDVGDIFQQIFIKIVGDAALTDQQKEIMRKIRDTPDFVLFLKSFALAFILVRNSGTILNAVGGIAGYAAGAIGLAVVA